MANHFILDSQITASSERTDLSKAFFGRLNLTGLANTMRNGWLRGREDTNPWLQVDFTKTVIVSGISTQGRSHGGGWVTTYQVSYGNNGSYFKFYEQNGQIRVSKKDTNLTSLNSFLPKCTFYYFTLTNARRSSSSRRMSRNSRVITTLVVTQICSQLLRGSCWLQTVG